MMISDESAKQVISTHCKVIYLYTVTHTATTLPANRKKPHNNKQSVYHQPSKYLLPTYPLLEK